MKAFAQTAVIATLALTLTAVPVFAQDHHDDQHHQDQRDHHHYVHHNDWRRGGHIDHGDWDRGEHVDWHSRHLRRPPRGYEWREVDGNYVMAAVATGIIASVIIASSQPH
ncbi:MAG TPA: RcnB family protein [Acidobacteriaceae bacterium]|jgi:Ni/Co efflux regulator RcnB